MLKISNFHNWITPLPDIIKEEIEQCMTTKKLTDGNALFLVGDKANELYQVKSGRVKCNMYSYDGKEVVMSTLLPGDCFGELGLMDNLPRATNTFAVGDTEVRVLGKKHFLQLSKKHPEINAQLLLMFGYRMRLAFMINTDNLTLSLSQRIARYINRVVISQSTESQDSEQPVLVDISHEMLGRLLGASRQSVSKELKLMEKNGAIEIKYGKIIVKDIKLLSDQYEHLTGNEQIAPDYS